MKILLVEDQKKLSATVEKGLKKLSYAVDCAYDGQEALALLEINGYDLVILDLNIPKICGLSVLKQLRETDSQTKVLILSALSSVEDKIQGLDLGANDYLEKPFDFLELSARIRNLLRWDFASKQTSLTIGNLTIENNSKQAFIRDQPLALTNKEYAILEYLALHRERYIPAEEIIEHVWSSDADPFSNAFKFHLHSLKKKLDGSCFINNLRGKGYQIHEKAL